MEDKKEETKTFDVNEKPSEDSTIKNEENKLSLQPEKSKVKIKSKVAHNEKKKRHILSTSIIVGVSIVIGAGGGLLLFRWNNPETASLGGTGYEGYVPTEKEVSKSLLSNSVEADYKDKYYQLVNYALSSQANYPYALTIGKATVTAKAGVTVEQKIQSCNYTTPEVIYNQNVSSSSVVKTANRFYDYLDGKVSCYLESLPTDWVKKSDPIVYTYDQYLQKYGKLLQGSYYCTTVSDASEVTEANPISDRYFTNKKEEYDSSNDKTKHHVNGVVIYLIGPNSVKASTFKKTDSGYTISLDLYTDKEKKEASDELKKKISLGSSYYSVQMRTTGGLNSRPVFSSTHLDFNLDDKMMLVSSFFHDEYSATVGPISSMTSSDMYQYYFRSENSSINGVELTVPKCDDEDNFKGYQLFPSEEV